MAAWSVVPVATMAWLNGSSGAVPRRTAAVAFLVGEVADEGVAEGIGAALVGEARDDTVLGVTSGAGRSGHDSSRGSELRTRWPRAVKRYLCNRLVGLWGMVIATRPNARAG